jgi:hypothetical protein
MGTTTTKERLVEFLIKILPVKDYDLDKNPDFKAILHEFQNGLISEDVSYI